MHHAARMVLDTCTVLSICFPAASATALSRVSDAFSRVRLTTGARFPAAHDLLDGIQVVAGGIVAQCVHPEAFGPSRCLRILGPGEAAGFCDSVVDWGLRARGYLVSLSEAELLLCRGETFFRLCRDVREISNDICASLGRDLALTRIRLARSYSEDTVANLAMELIVLEARFGDGGSSFALAGSTWRKILAEVLGISRETLQRAIRQLRAEGLLSGDRGSLRIADRPGLERRAKLDPESRDVFLGRRRTGLFC